MLKAIFPIAIIIGAIINFAWMNRQADRMYQEKHSGKRTAKITNTEADFQKWKKERDKDKEP